MSAHAVQLDYFDGDNLRFIVVFIAAIDNAAETAADHVIKLV